MDGYNTYNLVRVSDAEPKYLGFVWFLIATLLTCAEFYKLYLDSFCISQKFKVIKVVSSKQDINNPQYIQNYLPMAPSIVYMKNVTQYDGAMVLPPNMWGEPIPGYGYNPNDPLGT